MATKKIYDLSVNLGTYESQGQTKHKYQIVGSILQKDDGKTFMLLERTFNPAGVPISGGNDTAVLISLFAVKDKGAGGEAKTVRTANGPSSPNDFTDDIPF